MHDTTTYVYASREAPQALRSVQIDITEKAFRVLRQPQAAGRPTVAVDEDALRRLEPKGSWLLIILVGRPADVEEVGDWVKPRGLDAANRVRFFFPPGANLVEGLEPWRAKNLPPPAAGHYSAIPGFRRDVGVAINAQIERYHR